MISHNEFFRTTIYVIYKIERAGDIYIKLYNSKRDLQAFPSSLVFMIPGFDSQQTSGFPDRFCLNNAFNKPP